MRCTDLRRDQRGSATAEGVIVAPILILLFAGTLWAYMRYHTGEVAIDAVRDGLWPRAVAGCEHGPRDEELTSLTESFERRARAQVPVFARYYDDVRVDTFEADEVRIAERPEPLGRAEDELGYHAETSCNTVGVDYSGDFELAVQRTFCRAVDYCDDDCNCDEPPSSGIGGGP